MAFDYTSFLPFIVPTLAFLVTYIRKDTTSDINIKAIQSDVKQLREDVKGVATEQQRIVTELQEIRNIEDRLRRAENAVADNTDKINHALRNIDVLKVQVANLDDVVWHRGNRRTGAIENKDDE